MPRTRRAIRYRPPRLDSLVTLRNPSEKPAGVLDRYGRLLEPLPAWGAKVFAAKREMRPRTLNEEGAKVYSAMVVWTIRERDGLAPNVEVVDAQGVVHQSLGPPVERGGANGTIRTRYSSW